MAIPSNLNLNLNNKKQIEFLYIIPSPLFEEEKPYNISRGLSSSSSSTGFSPELKLEIPLTNITFAPSPTEITDLRSHRQGGLPDTDLETEGFIYAPFTSSLHMKPTYERASMLGYSKEMVGYLGKHVKADKIICYDMRLRLNDKTERVKETGHTFILPEPPITRPHMDHSRDNGWHRVAHHLTADEAEYYLNGNWRIQIYNIWRPLNETLIDMPFAICDPRTIREEHLIATDQIGQQYNGEIYYVLPDKDQQWYWLSNQTSKEACIFLSWDSHPPSDRINWCPHASFKDPDAPFDSVPRESVESRLITFTKLT